MCMSPSMSHIHKYRVMQKNVAMATYCVNDLQFWPLQALHEVIIQEVNQKYLFQGSTFVKCYYEPTDLFLHSKKRVGTSSPKVISALGFVKGLWLRQKANSHTEKKKKSILNNPFENMRSMRCPFIGLDAPLRVCVAELNAAWLAGREGEKAAQGVTATLHYCQRWKRYLLPFFYCEIYKSESFLSPSFSLYTYTHGHAWVVHVSLLLWFN